jgi:hypothetical protein
MVGHSTYWTHERVLAKHRCGAEGFFVQPEGGGPLGAARFCSRVDSAPAKLQRISPAGHIPPAEAGVISPPRNVFGSPPRLGRSSRRNGHGAKTATVEACLGEAGG